MRIIFIIICMAGIGMAMVHLRNEQNLLRNKTLTMQNYYQLEVPRELMQQQVELAKLTAPANVQVRAQEMALQLEDKDLKTRLAKNDTPDTSSPRHAGVPTVPAVRAVQSGRPDFGGGHD